MSVNYNSVVVITCNNHRCINIHGFLSQSFCDITYPQSHKPSQGHPEALLRGHGRCVFFSPADSPSVDQTWKVGKSLFFIGKNNGFIGKKHGFLVDFPEKNQSNDCNDCNHFPMTTI